jgi:hypothetical protein
MKTIITQAQKVPITFQNPTILTYVFAFQQLHHDSEEGVVHALYYKFLAGGGPFAPRSSLGAAPASFLHIITSVISAPSSYSICVSIIAIRVHLIDNIKTEEGCKLILIPFRNHISQEIISY